MDGWSNKMATPSPPPPTLAWHDQQQHSRTRIRFIERHVQTEGKKQFPLKLMAEAFIAWRALTLVWQLPLKGPVEGVLAASMVSCPCLPWFLTSPSPLVCRVYLRSRTMRISILRVFAIEIPG